MKDCVSEDKISCTILNIPYEKLKLLFVGKKVEIRIINFKFITGIVIRCKASADALKVGDG